MHLSKQPRTIHQFTLIRTGKMVGSGGGMYILLQAMCHQVSASVHILDLEPGIFAGVIQQAPTLLDSFFNTTCLLKHLSSNQNVHTIALTNNLS
jgi:hypothetical protein